jgi:hypothetical protein
VPLDNKNLIKKLENIIKNDRPSEIKAFTALEDLYFIVGISKENNRIIN